MEMKGSALALTACLAAIGGPASATVVDVTFQSTTGSELSGSFSYDTTQTPIDVDVTPYSTITRFQGLGPIDLTYRGNAYSISDYQLVTVDGMSAAVSGDELAILYSNDARQNGAITDTHGEIFVDDPTGQSVTGSKLPLQFNRPIGRYGYDITYDPPGGGSPTSSQADQGPLNVTFSPVTPTPELPAWASMLVGLGLVGGLAWWKSGRGSWLRRTPSYA
jgi:hypothetical protein